MVAKKAVKKKVDTIMIEPEHESDKDDPEDEASDPEDDASEPEDMLNPDKAF